MSAERCPKCYRAATASAADCAVMECPRLATPEQLSGMNERAERRRAGLAARAAQKLARQLHAPARAAELFEGGAIIQRSHPDEEPNK